MNSNSPKGVDKNLAKDEQHAERSTSEHSATWLQHGGKKHRVGRGLVSAIEQSVTFQTDGVEDAPVYARLSNTSNHHEVCTLLAGLERTEKALVFASGMAAMTAVLLTFLRPGDHILAQENGYGGNQGLFTKVMSQFQIECTFAPIDEWESHVRPHTRLAYFESISNPFCVPQNLDKAVAVAQKHKLISLCDNTFASPAVCLPSAFGVDLILESGTKYLNGHSDLVCGVVAGTEKHLRKIEEFSVYLGGFLSTQGCAQLLRGLRTLQVRMAAHTANALAFARGLVAEKQIVSEVFYGGLAQPDTAFQPFFKKGFGGMCCVRFAPQVNVKKMLRQMQIIKDVPSLGGTESTATMPYYTTNSWMSSSVRTSLGIDTQLVRFSVGLEDSTDLLQDVLAAARHSM